MTHTQTQTLHNLPSGAVKSHTLAFPAFWVPSYLKTGNPNPGATTGRGWRREDQNTKRRHCGTKGAACA